ncbi:Imm1 family immunity protein [Actinokineospora sp. NPDC004072]
MTPLRFWYRIGQGVDRVATTAGEIDAALDEINGLDADYGNVATVTRGGDESPVLYVGLNGDVGALYYTHADGGYYSRNTASGHAAKDTVTPQPVDRAVTSSLIYDWQQHVFEFPPDAELPLPEVRAAVHEFAQLGSRPTGVQWQEWIPPRNPEGESDMPDPFDPDVWG